MSSAMWPPSGGSGGGVSSLNTLTGDLTLVGGSGITITPSGSNITITASGTAPGGTSGQVQYNNSGAFGGFGSWNGTTLAITGAISSTTTLAVGTNLHVFGTSIMAGDMVVQGGANFSGNLGFYGVGEIAQPTGNVLTALSNLGLVASPTLSLSNLPSEANNTVLGNTSGISASPSALALGTVTEATSSILTLTGWSNATIGSPTILVKQAATAQSGYLSSTDWNTFNGKQASGSYLTALTGDGTASGPGSAALTLATVNTNVGSFGSASSVSAVTVNAKGLVTAAASTSIQIAESQVTNLTSDLAGKQAGPLTGDVTTSGAAATLATVNTNVGSFTNASITVNGKGLVTSASSGTAAKAPTIQKFLTGSGTYTTPTSPAPLYIRVRMVGGGGGGGAAGTGTTTAAVAGGASTFGTTLLSAGGGGIGGSGANGGTGGTSSLGTGPIGIALTGGSGTSATGAVNGLGGMGGSSAFGGGASGGTGNGAGQSAPANAGGGGGGAGASVTFNGASGGGSGGFIDALITSSISSTYSYSVGASGAGATITVGVNGGSGGSGLVEVTEYYQ